MAKRLRGGSATGGTGDLKPQILTIDIALNAIDDITVGSVTLPAIRFGPTQTKATITEILKVWFYNNMQDQADTTTFNGSVLATTNLGRITGTTATTATYAADVANTRAVASAAWAQVLSTNGGFVQAFPQVVDLTDQNGNGVLVAVDELFLVGSNVGGTTAGRFTAKILYRLVNVGVTEYVGILQSQQ